MATRISSGQRLIQSALALFSAQGITETTTKQIAEGAEVNEATLFRQFGNKNGLLLAVLKEGDIFQRLSQDLIEQVDRLEPDRGEHVFRDYAHAFLQALDQTPELVRSLIGEAGRYSPEIHSALGQGFVQVNQRIAEYFVGAIAQSSPEDSSTKDSSALPNDLTAKDLTAIFHSLLVGYAVIQLTGAKQSLWPEREVFLEALVTLLQTPLIQSDSSERVLTPIPNELSVTPVQAAPTNVADLPASLVHDILLRAKKRSTQDYAILYTLFGSGITPQDLIRLQRNHHISDRDQHLLQIMPMVPTLPDRRPNSRQVPINQWIMGKRYGTYQKNPLMQWLKSRKDDGDALFLAPDQSPLTLIEVESLWQDVTQDLRTVTGQSPHLIQAQQTWCVELLMRGVTPENMQILTGWSLEQLEPYVQRAKEKTAIAQVMQLDKKNNSDRQ